MTFKDPEQQREYQRKWLAKRRAAYLADKCCKICESTDGLEVDHIDPSKKVSHNVWSWSEKRRSEELAKCQILCVIHHKEKTAADRRAGMKHGANGMYYGERCRCELCKKFRREYVKQRRETLRHSE